ncbi:MAG: hypothetical protein ACPL1A_07630 [Candidatus Kapaibacteriota bacterium]
MKKTILSITILIIFLFANKSFAQELNAMGIGPFFNYSIGVNANDVPKGRQNGLALNNIPDFGITYYLPFSKTSNVGLSVDLAYITYSYIQKNYYTGKEWNHHFHYFEFNPSFSFSSFLLGFNFDFPLSGDIEGADIPSSKLSTLVGVKVGGSIELYSSETGRINLIIEGNYSFSGVFNDFAKDDPMMFHAPYEYPERPNNSFNTKPASLGIGFNYIFNLTKPPVSKDEITE